LGFVTWAQEQTKSPGGDGPGLLDPDLDNKFISKDSLQGARLEYEKPFFEDKSVVVSLEIKF
jgi:hypothetical protein